MLFVVTGRNSNMYFLASLCGVCLRDCKDVRNIKHKDPDDIAIVDKLKYCCFKTAWIDTDLSLFICYQCYGDLQAAYTFRKRCVSSSSILQGYVSRLKHDAAGPVHECGQLQVAMAQLDGGVWCEREQAGAKQVQRGAESAALEPGIRFVAVKQELAAASAESAANGSEEVNLLHVVHEQISHFLSPDTAECSGQNQGESSDSDTISAVEEEEEAYESGLLDCASAANRAAQAACASSVPAYADHRYLIVYDDVNRPPVTTAASQASSSSSTCAVLAPDHRNVGLHWSPAFQQQHTTAAAAARLFPCPVCAQRFANRSSLTKHLVLHSGGTEHRCRLCAEQFQYRCRLERHLARHHNIQPPP